MANHGNPPQLATAEGGAASKILPGGFSKGSLRGSGVLLFLSFEFSY